MYQLEHAGFYTDNLRAQGLDGIVAPQVASSHAFIEAKGRKYDVIMLYRVVVACFPVDLIRHNAPIAKIIFHTGDLHFLREER